MGGDIIHKPIPVEQYIPMCMDKGRWYTKAAVEQEQKFQAAMLKIEEDLFREMFFEEKWIEI